MNDFICKNKEKFDKDSGLTSLRCHNITQDKSEVILICVQLSNTTAYPHSLWLETGWHAMWSQNKSFQSVNNCCHVGHG